MTRSRIIVSKSEHAARAVKRRLATTPTLLPSQRPRSLTFLSIPEADLDTFRLPNEQKQLQSPIISEPGQPATQQTILHDQTTGLFSLALELRQEIYFLAFNAPEDEFSSGINVIQIVQSEKGGLCYVNCLWHGHSHHFTRCFQTCDEGEHLVVPPLYKTEHFDWCSTRGVKCGPLALLTTCRQIYREASDLLYSRHQFYLRHLFTVIDLSRTILPPRMNIIRTLRLVIPLTDAKVQDIFDHSMNKINGDYSTTEQEAFRVIAEMESLRELDVEFKGNIGRKPGRKVEVLLPLARVRQTDRFDVTVPWYKRNGEDQLGDVPYTLHWTEERYAYEGEDDSPWEDSREGEFDEDDEDGSSEEEGGGKVEVERWRWKMEFGKKPYLKMWSMKLRERN